MNFLKSFLRAFAAYAVIGISQKLVATLDDFPNHQKGKDQNKSKILINIKKLKVKIPNPDDQGPPKVGVSRSLSK